MSLFQCENCGCCENTALSAGAHPFLNSDHLDWTGIEDRKGKRLCSACTPARYADGTSTGSGEWHGIFGRVFLPLGAFRTDEWGNLEHIESGRSDFRAFEIPHGPLPEPRQ